jgi:hypothetical protein
MALSNQKLRRGKSFAGHGASVASAVETTGFPVRRLAPRALFHLGDMTTQNMMQWRRRELALSQIEADRAASRTLAIGGLIVLALIGLALITGFVLTYRLHARHHARPSSLVSNAQTEGNRLSCLRPLSES